MAAGPSRLRGKRPKPALQNAETLWKTAAKSRGAARGDEGLEGEEQHRGADRLDREGPGHDEAQQLRHLLEARHLEQLAHRAALADADALAQEVGQRRADRHDAQAAELDQDQDHHLAEEGELGARVPHGQARDAHRAGRREARRRGR